MTLQELFTQVKGKKQKSKPKIKTLNNGKHKIIAEGRHDNGIVKVYDNGYIFYSEDDHFTVFHISDVYGKREEYSSDDKMAIPRETRVIEGDFFNEQDWLFRVVMEGNARIQHNHNIQQNRFVEFRYSGIAEDLEELCYIPEYLTDDDSFRVNLDDIKEHVSPDLWVVYVSIKAFGITEAAIARDLNITQQAVSKRYRKACRTIPEVGKEIARKKRNN